MKPLVETRAETTAISGKLTTTKTLEIMETIYYLFGSEACEFYNENDDLTADELATAISEMHFALSVYDTFSRPSELLAEYDGWNDFIEINQELYSLLLKDYTNNY